MGSLLRKGTQLLDKVKHTKLHTELNQHLEGIGKFVEGEWVTMWARKRNQKSQVSFYNSIKKPAPLLLEHKDRYGIKHLK